MTTVAQQKIDAIRELVYLTQRLPLKPVIRKNWSELMITLLNDLEFEITGVEQ